MLNKIQGHPRTATRCTSETSPDRRLADRTRQDTTVFIECYRHVSVEAVAPDRTDHASLHLMSPRRNESHPAHRHLLKLLHAH